MNVAQRDKQRILADIVKQRFQLVFKKQRQIIFHACAEMAVADGFVHGGIVRIAIDFLAEAAAENLLRLAVGGELVRRQQADFGNGGDGALRVGVKGFDAVDFIVKQIDAVGHFAAHREQIDNAAAHGKLARRDNMGNMVVARIHQIGFQTAYIQSLPRFQPKRAPRQKRHGRQLLHRRGNRHEQHIRRAAFNLPQRRQPLRHQILMRRKTLVRQRFPVRQEHRRIVRAEKTPCSLKAQRLFRILGQHDFEPLMRQIARQSQRQRALRKIEPTGFFTGFGDRVGHGVETMACGSRKNFRAAVVGCKSGILAD